MKKETSSLHIVRRYGTVGGMERYVWELTHALSQLGQRVTILCEQACNTSEADIEIIELGSIKQKPRWISMLRFSANVSTYLNAHPEVQNNHIIHSHERTAVHQVTTFHGPPIKDRKKSILDFISPRLQAWDFLEQRELCAGQVKKILPNSLLTSEQLRQYYPEASNRIQSPAYPGVSSIFDAIPKKHKGKNIGFIGTEWKRKGLDIAVSILERTLKSNDDMHFIVAGPEPEDIQHLFVSWPKHTYSLIGWTKTEDFLSKINILIHPARKEPFGMVVAEANAASIPVIISDQCGIAPLIAKEMGEVIPLDDIDSWVSLINIFFNKQFNHKKLNLTWTDLATQHINLYLDID
jgi:UDP-glucose:(heptosyl)LPS alpha-1,3-glucosyltransferase